MHPELLEVFRAKRPKRISNYHQNDTVVTIESRHGSTTAMLIIGAEAQNRKPIYLCQDSGTSINASDDATAQQAEATLQKL